MNPTYASKLKSLHGYENFISRDKPLQQTMWSRDEKPVSSKETPWALIKQMINDCERLNIDDEETAEMLLDFVRELMSKEG